MKITACAAVAALLALASAAPAFAQPLSLTVLNNNEDPIMIFMVTLPSGETTDNIIDVEINQGEEFPVTIDAEDGECEYGVTIGTLSGESYEGTFDFCTTTTLEIEESGRLSSN